MRKGFTLIELLIVIAIIAILALIALPNFLEAQTRSKVARCLADMRSAATGMEAYYVDNNAYPMNLNQRRQHLALQLGWHGLIVQTCLLHLASFIVPRSPSPFAAGGFSCCPGERNVCAFCATILLDRAGASGDNPQYPRMREGFPQSGESNRSSRERLRMRRVRREGAFQRYFGQEGSPGG